MLGHQIKVEQPMSENHDIVGLTLINSHGLTSEHLVAVYGNSHFRWVFLHLHTEVACCLCIVEIGTWNWCIFFCPGLLTWRAGIYPKRRSALPSPRFCRSTSWSSLRTTVRAATCPSTGRVTWTWRTPVFGCKPASRTDTVEEWELCQGRSLFSIDVNRSPQ